MFENASNLFTNLAAHFESLMAKFSAKLALLMIIDFWAPFNEISNMQLAAKFY